MRGKEDSAQVYFRRTRDGLVVSRVVLHLIDAGAESDLRRFAERVTRGLVVPTNLVRDQSEEAH